MGPDPDKLEQSNKSKDANILAPVMVNSGKPPLPGDWVIIDKSGGDRGEVSDVERMFA